MFELKRLSKDGIPAALVRVERYRLLNEAWRAESICRDILEVEPDNQAALIALLLSITDQFGVSSSASVAAAREILGKIRGDYEKAYYEGIVCERWATGIRKRQATASGPMVYDWLRRAMEWFEKAHAQRPPANDDALLRWNTCARLIMHDPSLRPATEDDVAPMIE